MIGNRIVLEQCPMQITSNEFGKSYLEPLVAGNRNESRAIIDNALAAGIQPVDLLNQVIWPTMELLQSLYKEDRITLTQLNLATRLNRSITDQLCAKLNREPSNGKKALIFCG